MSVSVILPNYNHARWLPRALSALTQQDPQPAEIIVVDDASTDDSIVIIERFRREFPFIKLLRHEKNQGAEQAVKTGLAAATGEFLLFAAADDFVLPGLFAHAVPALHDNPDAAFFCAEVVLIDAGGAIIGFRPATIPQRHAGYMSPAGVRRALRSSDNWFVGTGVIYRRSHLAAIGYFDSNLATLQDALATRLLALRHGFYFAPQVLATWRLIPESLSVRSSLIASDNEALLAKARAWIARHFPEDMRDEYAVLFDRRLRFNFARSRLIWRGARIDTKAIADLFGWGAFDRAVLGLAARLPFAADLVMAWTTLRVRPYGLAPMLTAFLRSMTLNRKRRRDLAPLLRREI